MALLEAKGGGVVATGAVLHCGSQKRADAATAADTAALAALAAAWFFLWSPPIIIAAVSLAPGPAVVITPSVAVAFLFNPGFERLPINRRFAQDSILKNSCELNPVCAPDKFGIFWFRCKIQVMSAISQSRI